MVSSGAPRQVADPLGVSTPGVAPMRVTLLGVADPLQAADSLQVGERLPVFSLKTPDGKMVKSEALKGKVLVLDFWATWCAPCRKLTHEIDSALQCGKDLQLIGIDYNETALSSNDPVKYWKDHGYGFPMTVNDNEYGKSIGAGNPTVLVVDRAGVVRGRWDGRNEGTVEEIRVLVGRLLRDGVEDDMVRSTGLPKFGTITNTDIPGAPLLGQPVLITGTEREIRTEKHGLAYPAFYDWNHDGKTDLLLGEFETGQTGSDIKVYLNEGTNDKPKYSGRYFYATDVKGDTMTSYQWCCIGTHPRLVDLDHDGYEDILTGQYNPGRINWWRGSKDGFQPRQFVEQQGYRDSGYTSIQEAKPDVDPNSLSYWTYSSAGFGDFNGDGLADLFVGGFDELRVALNAGTAAHPRFGLRKYLLGTDGYPLSVVRPDDKEMEEAEKEFGKPHYSGVIKAFITPVDWDGDGVLDLLVTHLYGNSRTKDPVVFFRGVQTGKGLRFEPARPLFTAKDMQKTFPGCQPNIMVTDYNHDGVPDLVIGVSLPTVNGFNIDSLVAWSYLNDLRLEAPGKDAGRIVEWEGGLGKVKERMAKEPSFRDYIIGKLTDEKYLTLRHRGYVYVMLGRKNPKRAIASKGVVAKDEFKVPEAPKSKTEGGDGPVSYTVSTPAVLRSNPGQLEVVLHFKEGWYGYANTPGNIAGGWVPTRVEFHFPDEIMKLGSRAPEPHFKGATMVYSGDSVLFRQEFFVRAGRKDGAAVNSGEYTIGVTIQYQTCNEQRCLPPVTKNLEVRMKYDFSGTVLSATHQPLPLDPAVRYGKLSNGLTYFIRHNEEPKNRVVFYLVNKAGSILEDDDQQGLAHFMEHMSFNGTIHYPKNALIDYLQKNGVRFGADINAYTSFDETVYELPVPSDKPEVVNNGLQIIRDWAANAILDPAEIDKERGVVLEEKRLGKGASERLRQVYWPVILNGSRYSQRMPIGLDTVLDHFRPETIRRFYHDWYRPDLQAVVIVGDINADSMEREVKTRFADLRNPAQERPRTKFGIPLTGRDHFITATDREMTATQAEMIIKLPGLPDRTDADYRNGLIRLLFNRMMGERYGELARQADPPFVQASAGAGSFMGGLDAFEASVVARPGQLEQGYKVLWRELERVRQFGFTPSELGRAKAAMLSSAREQLKEKDKTNSSRYVKEYQDYFLKDAAAPGIEAEYGLTSRLLPGITLQEVNALLPASLKTTDRDIIILAPEKDKGSLPDSAVVTGWMHSVESEKLEAYVDRVSALPLLGSRPVAGKVVDEKHDQRLNVTTLKLSNGVTVVLKPTDFKNDQVSFSAFAPGGTSLYSDADYENASSAAGIVAAGGVGNYDLGELRKFLAGRQVGVQPRIGERSQGIGGSSTPADLELAMQLVYAYFTEPRRDEAAFRSLVERSRASLANRADDPKSVFGDSANAILGGYSIRRTGPSPDKLKQLDLDRAYRIYRERFADASAFTFTFVGNLDVAAIKPLLEKYLGGLPSTHAGEQAKDLGIHIPGGTMEKIIYKGTEPRATVYMVLSGVFDYNKRDVTSLDALKEVLQIRMIERLREDESGVYSPSVRVSTEKFPQGRYTLVVSFGCAPQNADKLVASALDEIAKVRKDGPLQANIDKWRAEAKAGHETAVKTNGFWLSYLSGQIEDKEDLHEVDGYLEELDRVTVGRLRDAARKYLSGGNYIRLELMPAAGGAGASGKAGPFGGAGPSGGY